MLIYYRDEEGILRATVDRGGIDMLDGKAYFSVPGLVPEIVIPVETIIMIREE